MHHISGRFENGQEGATNIFNVHQASPWCSGARDQYFACSVSKPDEIVYHQIGTEARRDAIRRSVSQIGGSEVIISKTRDVPFYEHFGFTVRRYRIERRLFGDLVRSR